MAILSALLSEQRIIMVSENVTTLSECMHGVVALLYPFNWQQIFVPLLPNALLDYLTAPMPFLIGIHASVRSIAPISALCLEVIRKDINV